MKQRRNQAQQAQQVQRNEESAAVRVNRAITEASAAGTVVDRDTARLIAACVHRGLGGELEHFASTGEIREHQVARLELYCATADEPRYTAWTRALRAFITEDERDQRGQQPGTKNSDAAGAAAVRSSQVSPAATNSTLPGRLSPPSGPLRSANPQVEDCDTCQATSPVVYVRCDSEDRGTRCHLALHHQALACRKFVRDRLHRTVEAVFVDINAARRGFAALLGHVATCHNRNIVVHRLDRLPAGGLLRAIRRRGSRVLSATEPNPRSPTHHQGDAIADITETLADPAPPGTRPI